MDFMDRMNYINLMNLSLSLMDEEEKFKRKNKQNNNDILDDDDDDDAEIFCEETKLQCNPFPYNNKLIL